MKKRQDNFIFESPDGGKTVYKRELGGSKRELIKEPISNTYLIEYRNIDGSKDSVEITTENIAWTLDQYSRNRSIAEYILVKKI
tara:strand:+ start:1290 stop:1541 length:252 start_codon:yes stop_codon:yes gene_type:complete